MLTRFSHDMQRRSGILIEHSRLGHILGNNLAQICSFVLTKVLGKSLKPLICRLLIENQ